MFSHKAFQVRRQASEADQDGWAAALLGTGGIRKLF